ncbi:hypothetical protein COX03_00935 [Candidatus Woesebacteria bacterium CG22_combo_CG10-13_8_21_14_all_39_10]|uniref:Uncharacterized protein n=2 Tax=Candidatus Woeseibacteriota TaxID=1752722 RepID=A0A2H0BJW2_9BACT|nr:MAG: hypothetical protein COX03_00935 [Candidatus Woesebacteria bacterium CG22_combo_CG10-13_8_21_14_all_39_10]
MRIELVKTQQDSPRISPDTCERIILQSELVRPLRLKDPDILFINVPTTFQQGVIADGEEPPWGLLRLATASTQIHRLSAGILDAHRLRLGVTEIESQIRSVRPRVIGINPTSMNVPEARQVANICSKLGIAYIVGGVHATLDPRIAKEDFSDAEAIVRGNGEIVIGNLVRWIENLKNNEVIPGVYYKNQNVLDRHDYAPKIDLNTLPTVHQNELIIEPVYKHQVTVNGVSRVIREATLYVTQGCPFNCSFCSSPTMVEINSKLSRPYSRPNTSKIVDQVEDAIDLGADALHFLDDMAFVSSSHIKEFHKTLTQRKLLGKFIWNGHTRVGVITSPYFDETTMEMMKETGVWKLGIGIESGNNTILKRIGKKTSVEQVSNAVTKLAVNKIDPKGYFIMGFPGETWEQMLDTYNFIMELKQAGMTDLRVFQFKPFPGTREYEYLQKTNPGVLLQINYLRHVNTGLTGEAQNRFETNAWLPEDIMISQVRSGEVQQLVMKALNDFFAK